MFLFQAIGAFAFKNLSVSEDTTKKSSRFQRINSFSSFSSSLTTKTLFVNNVHRLCFRITNQQQQPVTIRAGKSHSLLD